MGNRQLPKSSHTLTIEAFAQLSDEPWRAELVRGCVIREPPAGFEHGRLTARIASLLDQHVREHGLGVVLGAETGFVLSDDPPTVRAPDVAFVSVDRLPPPEEMEGFAAGAPDLAVEVVSPSNTASDLQAKVMDYLAAGCSLVWVIDPRTRSVTAYHSSRDIQLLRENDVLDAGEVLPRFALALAELFDDTACGTWPP